MNNLVNQDGSFNQDSVVRGLIKTMEDLGWVNVSAEMAVSPREVFLKLEGSSTVASQVVLPNFNLEMRTLSGERHKMVLYFSKKSFIKKIIWKEIYGKPAKVFTLSELETLAEFVFSPTVQKT